LIQLKQSMHLAAATDQALDSHLNATIQYSQNNPKSGACIHLSGFATQVETYLQACRLTQTQASQLLQGAVGKVAGCYFNISCLKGETDSLEDYGIGSSHKLVCSGIVWLC
jgi:hypothetical protein